MSHAEGHVLVDGEIVAYFEYNGTADVARPRLFHTRDELEAHWREDEWPMTCGDKGECVMLHSTYGNGFSWDARACLVHMLITDNFIPYENDGPEWFTPTRQDAPEQVAHDWDVVRAKLDAITERHRDEGLALEIEPGTLNGQDVPDE